MKRICTKKGHRREPFGGLGPTRKSVGFRKRHPTTAPRGHLKQKAGGRLKRVGLFFCCARAPLLQQLASSRTPLALLAPAPPIVICVIAARSLAPDGPHPLPVSGGGHASQRQLSPVTLHPGAPRAMYFLRLCARATSPNSTLTLALDLSLNRLKPWLYLISPKTASGSMGRILL